MTRPTEGIFCILLIIIIGCTCFGDCYENFSPKNSEYVVGYNHLRVLNNLTQSIGDDTNYQKTKLISVLSQLNLAKEFFNYIENINTTINNKIINNNDLICLMQLNSIKNALKHLELWSFEFLDAWGGIPSGIMYGNIIDIGNFDQCINITKKLHSLFTVASEINGKYCHIEIPASVFVDTKLTPTMNNYVKARIGLCIPATCDGALIARLIREYIKLDLNITVEPSKLMINDDLCSKKESVHLDSKDWWMVGIIAILIILMLLSTGYDIIYKKLNRLPRPLLTSFSIPRNMKELFHIKPNSRTPSHVIPCLNGVRVLSVVWVIFGHCYFCEVMLPNNNFMFAIDWMTTPFSMFAQSAEISVDSFFFLSGLLVALVSLRHIDKHNGKLNVPLMYLHRYVRLTPVLAITMLSYLSLCRYSASGPFWKTLQKDYQVCDRTWWATLFYVQNYLKETDMCLPHAWYLSVDTQLYVIAPAALFALYKWGKRAVAGICITGILLSVWLFATIIINQISIFDKVHIKDLDKMFDLTYNPTPMRASPWIVGLILGYYIFTLKGRHIYLTTKQNLLGWTVSLAIIFSIIFGMLPRVQKGAEPITVVEDAFYTTLSRIGWPIALSWIVFSCAMGYGGLTNDFLSFYMWQPISKLSYSMYLSHVTIQKIMIASVKSSTNFSDFSTINFFWANLGHTFVFSLVLYLAVEAPIGVIENVLLGKIKPIRSNIQPSSGASQGQSTENLYEGSSVIISNN